MGELATLPNIGPVVEGQLEAVGITTADELRRVGACEAWLRILAQDPSACINRLCGLEGAVQGMRWHQLPATTKAELKTFYKKHHPDNKLHKG